MKTFITQKLRLASTLAFTALAATLVVSCSDSKDEDLSHTIPTIPEDTLTGYKLTGPIEIEGYDPELEVYPNRIIDIYFSSDSSVTITYDDNSTSVSSYTYTPPTDKPALISILVPDNRATTELYDEFYVLTLINPSTHFQVELGNESAYQTQDEDFFFYAVNGSLNFTRVD